MGETGGLLPASVGDVLERALAQDPAREALVCADARLTYEELDWAADRAAAALSDLGVREDDVVAVSLPNTSNVVVTFHALLRLGAIWLGVNRNLAPPEKDFILRDANARLFLASADAAALSDGPQRPPTVVIEDGAGTWLNRLGSGSASYRRANRRPTDRAAIAYTSGTTGRPKGVVHSHQNLLLPGAVLVQARGFGPELRKGDCAALTILNLQVTSTLLVAQATGTQVVMDRVDPVGVASWVARESVNSWFGVPTILQGLAGSEQVSPDDLASLADVWTGGTYLPESVRDSFEARFGCRVSATYGLTEAPTVVAIEDRDDGRVPGSSGTPLPHLEVEIRDGASVVAIGEVGEITVRAKENGPWAGVYQTMLGYLGQPDQTAKVVRDGVLYTGDVGFIDAEGRLFVRDRRNALILRGGANVYPAEVERVLLELPDVRGASVVGVPDERLGQRVAAAVEPEEGHTLDVEEISSYCSLQLARYKVPEQWKVATLPRNAMGKVLRSQIEKWFTESTEPRGS